MTITRREFLTLSAASVLTLPRQRYLLAEHGDSPLLGDREPPPEPINGGPFLSEPIQNDVWTSGWTIARPFAVEDEQNKQLLRRYLFLLKTGNGRMHINPLSDDGKLRTHTHSDDWSGGWTDAEFFTTNSGTYLIILKKTGLSSSNHRAHVYRMNSDGSVGARVDFTNWESGWTNVVSYSTASGPSLLLYRSGTALNGVRARVYRIHPNGTLSANPQWTYSWEAGWTAIAPYIVGGQTRFLLVRTGSALPGGTRARILTAQASGSIDSTPVQDYGWGGGWAIAKTFEASSRSYLLLYNADGRVHVHAIRPDGRVGSRVAWYATPNDGGMDNGSLGYRGGPIRWTTGWTSIEPFQRTDGTTGLFTLKSGNGRMHVSRVQPMSDVGPAVTHVDERNATIWIGLVGGRLENRPAYEVEYRDGNSGGWQTADMQLEYATHPPGDVGPVQDYYAAGIGKLAALQPSRNYEYRVLGGRSTIGQGRFVTAPLPGAPANFRVVVASCMDLARSRVQPAWDHVLGVAPTFVLLTGDTAYANTTDRSMQWAEHIQQRTVPSFAKLISSVPVFAQWDDHDFGPNNSAGLNISAEKRAETRDTFRELFPNPLRPDVTGANYFRVRWGKVDFFVLDNRYFAHKHNSSAGSQLIGNSQWQWLESELQASTATFKVITSGVTLNHASASETWLKGYPGEFLRLLALVRSHEGVFLVTGDIHSCHIRRHTWNKLPGLPPIPGIPSLLKYPLYEVISSGVGRHAGDPTGSTANDGFAVLDFDLTSAAEKVSVTLHEQDGSARETRIILRSELQ